MNESDRFTAATLSVVCLFAAVLLAWSITARDEEQTLIHQRDVAPELQRCEVKP
jgi:hypothetical protein